MPTVKIIQYTAKTNTDGTSPIVIQVFDVKKYKRTLANVRPDQWDADKLRVKPKSHPNYATINIKISNEYNRLEKLILNNQFNLQRDFIDHFANLKAGVDPETHTPPPVAEKTFKDIIKLYVTHLKSGQSKSAYEIRLNYFIDKATLPEDLRISQITTSHIDKYYAYQVTKGNKPSSIRTNIKIIKFAANFAFKAGYDVMSKDLANYKLPKAGRTIKEKLTIAELAAFARVELKEGSRIKEIQDMFMLAVYLRGMRIGDVIQLKQDYVKTDRVVYVSEKNEKTFNIKLVPEAVQIVNRYLDGREYLFTFFKWKFNETLSADENAIKLAEHIKSITANINGKLKIIAGKAEPKITKNVSTHIARHTFAKMAIDKVKDLNISMDLVGHSRLKDHEDYIRELSQDDDLDAAADSIFS